MDLASVIDGTILGDASVRIDKEKYFYYSLAAKDKKFLVWMQLLFNGFGIPTYITSNNRLTDVSNLGFYINARNDLNLSSLRERWYAKPQKGSQKIIQKDLKLTSKTVLFWYLGDGCLARRKNDNVRLPTIVLATNCFTKSDIDVLIKKLAELNLNFYPVEYTSGFTGKKCGYCLYSVTGDGTPYRFFEYIGLECPPEIANCSTGRKGRYREEHFFKNKWPTQDEWIRILSNVQQVGPKLREKRLALGFSQSELARRTKIRRENIRDLELQRKRLGATRFRTLLHSLEIQPSDLF